MNDTAKWQKLIDIMATLRGPNGCPWDKAQDHDSLRRYFLEETYEVLDAINSGSQSALCDELGDVLLQVVFHARLAEEEGAFTIDDVVDGVCDKMIRRHPHIFGSGAGAENAEQVLTMWEAIKAAERKDRSEERRGVMQINDNLPALMLAEKTQNKAHRVGFDWPLSGMAAADMQQQAEALSQAVAARQDKAALEDSLGQLLFAAVGLARDCDIDPEQSLRKTVRRFIERFNYIEQQVEADGGSWTDHRPPQLKQWYNAAEQKIN